MLQLQFTRRKRSTLVDNQQREVVQTMTVKYEKIILTVAIQTYGINTNGTTALDVIVPLAQDQADLVLLDYDTEDMELIEAKKEDSDDNRKD